MKKEVKELKSMRFLMICEDIKRQRKSPQGQRSYKIGKRRQEKMITPLQELKEEGIIRDFLETGDLSFQDVMKGIDFFVVYVDDKSYKVLSLSVTGEGWIRQHRVRHPEIPIIAINLSDTPASIKNKIMEAIRNGGDKKIKAL